MKQNSRLFSLGAARWVVAPVALAVLAACGGSSGDDPKPEPIVKRLLTGQVAVGALVSDATVSITCAVGGGVGTATSGAAGAFEIELSADAVRPCIGTATIPGGGTMRTVIPGGEPAYTVINFTPLTDGFVSYLLGQTDKGQGADPTALIRSPNALFTQLVNSRLAFDNSKVGYSNFMTSNGIDLSGFDFMSSRIVVGQPADNALEDMRNIPGLMNPDGTVSNVGRTVLEGLAPVITPADIPACDAPGNSCGGSAGRTVIITGGTGT